MIFIKKFGKSEHMSFNLLNIAVCFSLHSVWFFFVNNFCNSCISLAKNFYIISLVLNSSGKSFIFSAIYDCSLMSFRIYYHS